MCCIFHIPVTKSFFNGLAIWTRAVACRPTSLSFPLGLEPVASHSTVFV